MNITYLVLFNLGLACWLGLYALIFSRSTFFRMNRLILLGGILVAAVVPLIQPVQWVGYPAVAFSGTLTPAVVGDIGTPVAYTVPASHAFPFRLLIMTIYWSGVAVMTLMLLRKLAMLYRAVKKFPRRYHADHVHLITPDSSRVFSFAGYLFAPADIPGVIYRHELIHIRQKHTADNLLLEIVKIFCWFNPAVYLYQKTLRAVHEYLADDRAAGGMHKSKYARLLIGHLLHVPAIPLTHRFFNRSLLQKRLIMLRKERSPKKAGRKYLLMIPVLVMLIFISASSFALRDRVDHALEKAGLAGAGQPVVVSGVVTDQSGHPLPKVTVMQLGTTRGTITDAGGHFTLKDVPLQGMLRFSMIGYSTITAVALEGQDIHITLYREPERMEQLTVVGYAKEKTAAPAPTHRGQVLTFVEQMPRFPGGKAALMKFLRDHVRYPQQARAQHLQGNVLVSFVVGKDGHISRVHTVNDPIGGGLEQEAVRVVKAMPGWDPGRQNGGPVAVLYTLPIRFVLQ